MSRDWTKEELQAASMAMQKMGELGYEKFCEKIGESEYMEVRFDLTGTTRKKLVKAAAQIMGMKAIYKKLTTLAYELAGFTFTKEGTLVWDERTASETAEKLVSPLQNRVLRYCQRPQSRPQRTNPLWMH